MKLPTAAAAWSGGVFSMRATRALPMMAASANSPTDLTWSALEIPKPTAMGSLVNWRRRATSCEASLATCCWVPVMPTREMA